MCETTNQRCTCPTEGGLQQRTHRIRILGWIPGHVALAERTGEHNGGIEKPLKNQKHPMNK